MRKYVVRLLSERNAEGVLDYGFGDWCAVSWAWNRDRNFRTSNTNLVTAFAYGSVRDMVRAAEALGIEEDRRLFAAEADRLKAAFNRKFYRGNGVYDRVGSPTAQATALEFGLVEDAEVGAVRKRLVEAVHEMDDRIDFGIIGARTVFRQLCEAGEPDLAWKLATRKDGPSFVSMVSQGVNTLMETFAGRSSRNHVMFCDIAAWAYEYLAGIRVHEPPRCGPRRVTIRPCPPKALGRVKASVELPEGCLAVAWVKQDGEFVLTLDQPNGVNATVVMPDGRVLSGHARHQVWRCVLGRGAD